MSISNFFDDGNTDTLSLGASSHAYYYIDNISVIEDTLTSIIANNLEFSISIMPNPVINFITLNSHIKRINFIEIFDLTSKIVKSLQPLNTHSVTINFSDFASSVYFLKATTNQNKSLFFKILKL
jgi:hypothetical protein